MRIKSSLKSLGLGLVIVFTMPLMACDEYWVEEEAYIYSESVVVVDVDLDDASGGLEYWSSLEKGSFRSYHADYRLDCVSSTCTDLGYFDAGLNLPSYLYGYEYGNWIDFENSAGQLAWNAAVNFDDTFSFSTNFINEAGYVSVDMPCSCLIENRGYIDEYVECVCEPSNISGSCEFYYDAI